MQTLLPGTGGDKHILFISSFIGFTCLSSFARCLHRTDFVESQIPLHNNSSSRWRGYNQHVCRDTERFSLSFVAGRRCGIVCLPLILSYISSTTFSFFFIFFICFAVQSNNNNLDSAIRSVVLSSVPWMIYRCSLRHYGDSDKTVSTPLHSCWHCLSGFVVAKTILHRAHSFDFCFFFCCTQSIKPAQQPLELFWSRSKFLHNIHFATSTFIRRVASFVSSQRESATTPTTNHHWLTACILLNPELVRSLLLLRSLLIFFFHPDPPHRGHSPSSRLLPQSRPADGKQ